MPHTPSTDTTTPIPWVQFKQRTEHADLIAYLFKPPTPALQYVQASPFLAIQFVRLINLFPNKTRTPAHRAGLAHLAHILGFTHSLCLLHKVATG